MLRWLGIAVACFVASPALAQFLAPPAPPPPPQDAPAETPELKPPPSPIITVRNRALLSVCRKLGPVQAIAEVAGRTGLPAYDAILVEMKEKALDAGGTHLLLIDTYSGTVEAKGTGEAFQCPPGKGPSAVVPKH